MKYAIILVIIMRKLVMIGTLHLDIMHIVFVGHRIFRHGITVPIMNGMSVVE